MRRAHHRAQLGHQLERVALGDELLQLGDPLLEPLGVDRGPRQLADLRVRRGRDLLTGADELLVELLARAHADELDLDIAIGLLARQADHVAGEIDDLDRVAHVQHVDLATPAQRARLHDERHGLRDRHEVARHLRVGHRHGAAARDLLLEDRDHRARRAEHVAEAHRNKARLDVGTVAERLDDPLAQRLRLAHHRLGCDGLVGRDEHEDLGAGLGSDLGERPRGERVVAHRLERVRLHQRHVLVRGGVEDDRGPVALEDAPHLGAVLDVADHRHDGREVALVDQLPLDLEQRRLRVVDDDQPLAADLGDLPAELGADRAARAGHHHGLASDVRGDLAQVDVDLLAPEHVLHLHRADLPRQVHVAGDQLVEAGQRAHRDALALGHLDDPGTQAPWRRRDGDQHLVGPVVVQDSRQLVGRAEHAHALEPHVALLRVVVDQPDRREARLPLQLAHDELGRATGADDQHLAPARDQPERVGPLDQRARDHARSADQGEREQEVQHGDRAGQAQRADRLGEVDDDVGEHARGDDARARPPHVPGGEVPPPTVREAEQHEDDDLDRDNDPDRTIEERLVEDRQPVVEAELEGEHPGGGDQPRIDAQLPDAVMRQG